MRHQTASTLLALALTLGSAAAARADAAFELQPALGLGTSVQPPSATAGSGLPQASFTVIPMLRGGVHFRPLALLLSFSYSSAGTSGLIVNSLVRIGADAEIAIWRSTDERVNVYGLLGVGALVTETGSGSPTGMRTSAVNAGATLSLGFGGMYAVHPNFSVGLELGARPDFVPLDAALFVATDVYVAFTGTFIGGRRHF